MRHTTSIIKIVNPRCRSQSRRFVELSMPSLISLVPYGSYAAEWAFLVGIIP